MAKINLSSFYNKKDGNTVFEKDWKQQQEIIVTAVNATDDEVKANKTAQDGIAARVTTAEGDIDSLETRASDAEGRLDSAEGRLSSVEEKNTSQDSRLTNVEDRATSAESRLSTVESNKTDKMGDHAGTWRGLLPSQADETIASVVTQHDIDLNPTSTQTMSVFTYNMLDKSMLVTNKRDFIVGNKVIVQGAGTGGTDLKTRISDIVRSGSYYKIFVADNIATDPTGKLIKHETSIPDQIGSLSEITGKHISEYGSVDTDATLALKSALTSNDDTIILPKGTYRATDTILVDNALQLPKRVIGSPEGTIISVDLSASKTFLNIKMNVEFHNITFDFNNKNVQQALFFRENLGKIVVKNCKFINVKDMDSTTSSSLIYIINDGNKLALEGLDFENILKLGNGNITDGAGVINCIYAQNLNGAVTPNALDGGFIRDCSFKDIHNINSSGAIIYEDTTGIYLQGSDIDKEPVIIENIRGYNFGKRLIKTQISNAIIRDVDGYSNTNDAISVLGILNVDTVGDRKNFVVSNIKCRGKIGTAIATSANNVRMSDLDINTEIPVMTGNSPNAIGVYIQGDQTTVSNFSITAERAFYFPKSSGGVWKDTTLLNGKITIPSWGHTVIDIGFLGFENLNLINIKAHSYSSTRMFFNTSVLNGTTDKKGKGLKITGCSMRTEGVAYGMQLQFIDDISITDFTFDNTVVTRSHRGVLFDNCKNVRITNFNCPAYTQSAIQTSNCEDVVINDLKAPTSDYVLNNSNSTKVRAKGIDKTKVALNDDIARKGTFLEQESSSGSAVNRPTNPAKGHTHYDETLKKDVKWDGTIWRDQNGSPAWTPSKTYAVNDKVVTDNNVYQCTVAGTTGTVIPTHTTGTATDGTVTWSFVKSII